MPGLSSPISISGRRTGLPGCKITKYMPDMLFLSDQVNRTSRRASDLPLWPHPIFVSALRQRQHSPVGLFRCPKVPCKHSFRALMKFSFQATLNSEHSQHTTCTVMHIFLSQPGPEKQLDLTDSRSCLLITICTPGLHDVTKYTQN